MAKKTYDELLLELTQKQDALQNRIASLQAKKKKTEDKILTRKKILIGAYMLEKFKDRQDAFQNLISEMDTFLTRSLDRELFGLTAKSESERG